MPTSTSLNLQALLKTAAARTGMDESASRVRGLSSAAQAMYVAVQASHRKNVLCFVLVPTDEDVERFACDVRFFIGALEGASGSALEDRKSTRLNSSHVEISYAVFCLKKKT